MVSVAGDTYKRLPRKLATAILLSCCCAKSWSQELTPKPHILFFLTDDLGWNAPGFHNPSLITPTLDELHRNGVELVDHHVYKYCSPTRASFLSGRYPFKLGATRANTNPASITDGLDLSYATIANKMQTAGYFTAQFGKWHAGFFQKEYTPMYRGFNYSLGFLTGGEDHYSQETICYGSCAPYGLPGRVVDIWETDHPKLGANGTWSAELFTQGAVNLIERHATDFASTPLFIYFALHNTHGPTEAPSRLINLYRQSNLSCHNGTGGMTGHTDCRNIHTFAAMISAADESVRNVTEAMKRSGLWDNTLLVWTTDNGAEIVHTFSSACENYSGDASGPYCAGGSNAPLRGGKGSNWEGGHRVPTIVSGPRLPSDMRGKSLKGLAHITDWYTTFSTLANVDPSDPAGVSPIDGLDLWPWISGSVSESPRRMIVHDHNYFCPGPNQTKVRCNTTWGAIRKENFKLMIGMKGHEGQASWFGEFTPNVTTPNPVFPSMPCSRAKPCLFDLERDLTERFNVAEKHQKVVADLLAEFDKLETSYHPPINCEGCTSPGDERGFCEFAKRSGGFLGPWQDASRDQSVELI